MKGLRGSRLVIAVTAFGLIVFLAWAAFAPVEEVARAQGKVIPSSRGQIIQSSEPATVRAILVRGGQKVTKGELLVRMDDTESSSALGQIQAEDRSLTVRAARLGQEAQGQSYTCPDAVKAASPDDCAKEAQLQQVRSQALSSKREAALATVEQRRRDLAEAQATTASLRNSQALAQKQVDMLEPLAAKSIVPQTELLQARRDLSDIQGRLAASEQAASRAQAAIAEAQAQVSETVYQFRQEAMDEASQLNAKLAVIHESSRGAEGKLDRTELRSPVEGVVNDVQVNTVGGFVNAGQKIMEIVPVGDKLLVETRVKPADIAFIRVGQAALVKVTAYDFSIYGGIPGHVVQVSADSIYDEQAKEAYFTVLVETTRAFVSAGGRNLPITPGMVCTADIITGRKTVLDYLLKPVLKARSEALRER
ncbi:HlyD family type I secretion periplasmic adaptor subunit [Caulobacter sp. KR2-114]|uniref:HlyD family type I secretion periplasmic adaptor subunit n=1 Tax=Caulobacter sp. KR2-114 TaxID=3400912 RepID=UPI003C01839A